MRNIIIVIIIILLVGGGIFLYMHKNQMQSAQNSPAMTAQNGTQPTEGKGHGHFNMPAGSTPIFGSVTAVSGNTLTVQRQSRNGGSSTLTVDLISSTQYTGGSQSSIQTGTRIGGYGTKNSDGSINAESIMVNPTMMHKGAQNGNQNSGQ